MQFSPPFCYFFCLKTKTFSAALLTPLYSMYFLSRVERSFFHDCETSDCFLLSYDRQSPDCQIITTLLKELAVLDFVVEGHDMKAAGLPEVSVNIYKDTRRHNSED